MRELFILILLWVAMMFCSVVVSNATTPWDSHQVRVDEYGNVQFLHGGGVVGEFNNVACSFEGNAFTSFKILVKAPFEAIVNAFKGDQ